MVSDRRATFNHLVAVVSKGLLQEVYNSPRQEYLSVGVVAVGRDKADVIVYRGIGWMDGSGTKHNSLGIRRCNNYDMLKSIPCSPECKIVEKILLDHPLSYALTATADVPVVYLQQFQDSSQMETPDNPFVAPVTIEIIESFMNKVDYQDVVDKVSDFYMKNLAQPWQTMFKVFNRFLTTRTSGHGQTKINILQLFHVVINRTNIDYAALLWWDFMNNVFQKKEAIQYPRFIKLMIIDLMKKFPNIPQRINGDYHSIKDYIPLVSVYTTGNMLVRGMLIPDEFMTEEIHATDDFKEHKTVSTPRAHRTPTVSTASPQGKKRKQTVRESNSPRKSQKITIKKKKQSSTLILPPCDDRERDEVAKATILSLTLHKTALAVEAQENIAKVKQKLDVEEIEKMVEGDKDEESYASVFVDSMINNDGDDFGTKIEPESHKGHPEIVIDDDDQIKKEKNDEELEKEKKHDDDERIDEVVMEKDNDDDVEKVDEGVKEKCNADVAMGSMVFRKEKMQTPIPSPIRSYRKVSSSDKTVTEELIDTTKILPGSIAGMCRRRGQIRSHIKNKFITHDFFMGKIREVLDHCNKVVPELTFAKTNEMINKEMPCLVNLAVNKDREVDPINAQEMISKEFATHAPKMIEVQFRKHMQHTTLNLYPKTSSSTAEKSIADLQQQLYLKMKSTPQDQAADLEL
ncbi:hypothetical protein Tco_0184386 [Tanacetum coccineum]